MNDIQRQQLEYIRNLNFIGSKEILPPKKIKKEEKCSCKGKDGQAKQLYQSEREARNVAFDKKNEVLLSVYPCPKGFGYHLTKNCL